MVSDVNSKSSTRPHWSVRGAAVGHLALFGFATWYVVWRPSEAPGTYHHEVRAVIVCLVFLLSYWSVMNIVLSVRRDRHDACLRSATIDGRSALVARLWPEYALMTIVFQLLVMGVISVPVAILVADPNGMLWVKIALGAVAVALDVLLLHECVTHVPLLLGRAVWHVVVTADGTTLSGRYRPWLDADPDDDRATVDLGGRTLTLPSLSGNRHLRTIVPGWRCLRDALVHFASQPDERTDGGIERWTCARAASAKP